MTRLLLFFFMYNTCRTMNDQVTRIAATAGRHRL